AKGYPDISTRTFLHRLSQTTHEDETLPPIYALTDFDPDGVAIMSTYKHGSHNLSHESINLSVISIQWLGIKSVDIHPNIEQTTDTDDRNILKLSGRDRRKAIKILENNAVLAEGGSETEWRRELQVMLMLSVKAEMEILAERNGGVGGWVETELVRRAEDPSSAGFGE
ncbi:MAG: hypothetical protein Q9164_006780, partial [Protoblastenia rupestris]